MSDIAIKVEGLSKRYKIGRLQKRHDTLRDRIADTRLFNLFKRRNGNAHHSSLITHHSSPSHHSDLLWALKDVSFEVKRGEVVGIIGRNGAGKSTLLKILSRITEPTEGYADINGRVGSLLEVGTGFHPELTGRENIYLNGSILGMKRAEINNKFDEIVAFAEIEKFMDTPVKHYSSGMYVRLAFAVAAHLDPEILLVDEVLAVGDVAFQKKCLGKMGDIAKEGRTVLFVSHNLGAIDSLTGRCAYLLNGKLLVFDSTREVIERYLSDTVTQPDCGSVPRSLDLYRRNPSDNHSIQITGISLQDGAHESLDVSMDSDLSLNLQFDVRQEITGANLTVVLKNGQGNRVATLFSWDQRFALFLKPGRHLVRVTLKGLSLSPGQYLADVGINQSTETTAFDVIIDYPVFRIVNAGQVIQWLDRPWGAVHCKDTLWEVLE